MNWRFVRAICVDLAIMAAWFAAVYALFLIAWGFGR